MKNVNVLSKSEMKRIMGGKKLYEIELCDSSNGTLWHSQCYFGGYYLNANNEYEWAKYNSPNLLTWDAEAPCGGQCTGKCVQYYACDDQFIPN